ncbi:MAG: hypothetical protein WC477_03895 [Patescibacteria group bacterium]
MFPLGYLLVAWLILLLIHGLVSLLTLIQILRYGSSSSGTYFVCFIFVGVIALVVLGTGKFLLDIDWNTPVSIIPQSLTSIFGRTATDIPLQP